MRCESNCYVSLFNSILPLLRFWIIFYQNVDFLNNLYEFNWYVSSSKNVAQQSEAHMGMLELLKSRALLMPLGIGIVMQLSQQLSGKWLKKKKIKLNS